MLALPASLSTARLRLERFAASHVDALAAIYADPVVMQHVGGVRTRQAVCDEVTSWVAAYELHGIGPYALVESHTGRLVGRCGLAVRQLHGEVLVELGYLLERNAWGKGYATEAARAVLDAAWSAGLRAVVALVGPNNAASVAVAERAGMSAMGDTLVDGERMLVYAAQLAGL